MLALLLILLLITNNSWGEISKVLEVGITGNNLSLDQALVSKDQQDYTVNLKSGAHTVKFGIDLGGTPIRANTLYSLNYFYDWRLTNFFSNESGLGLGYFNSDNLLRDVYKFTLEETMLGAADYFQFKLNEKSQFRIGASALRDVLDQENSWDSAKWGADGKIELDLPVIRTWLLDFTTFSQTYNPNRYWFADRRNFLDLRIGPSFAGNGWQSNIFGGAIIDRLNSEPGKKILAGGLNFGLQISQNNELELKLSSSSDTLNQIASAVMAIAWRKPNQSYEIYGLVRNGPVWQEEKSIGLKIQLVSAGAKKEKRGAMPIPEEYREPAQRSEFYSRSGFTDDPNLSLWEQTARLNSLRLRSEWSSNNLRYRFDSPGLGYQTPIEIYNLGSGNCYYQSNLNAWMDQKNDYHSYGLAYYPEINPIGHEAEIVQDFRTGRWFMYENGLLQEIRVNRDAKLETVAWEALKQGTNFTTVPIGSSKVTYTLSKLANDVNGFDVDFARSGNNYWERSDFQSTTGKLPRVEKGFELFFGPDTLWR